MPDDDIEVIHMTALDWDAALSNSLQALGLTWEMLTAQARDGDFESLKARQLWLMAGGQGPNQAEGELIRLRNRIAALEANGAELLARAERAEQGLTEAERRRDRYEAAWELSKRDYQHVADQLYASCICNTGPDTDGPEYDCPVHGAPEWQPGVMRARLTAAEDLAERWENALAPDRTYARSLRTALDDALSPADARTPVSAATEAHGGAGEAQEGSR